MSEVDEKAIRTPLFRDVWTVVWSIPNWPKSLPPKEYMRDFGTEKEARDFADWRKIKTVECYDVKIQCRVVTVTETVDIDEYFMSYSFKFAVSSSGFLKFKKVSEEAVI